MKQTNESFIHQEINMTLDQQIIDVILVYLTKS